LQRNESKKLILQVAEDFNGWAEAGLFQTWTEDQYNATLSDKGVQMALLRCHRQGLLYRKDGKYQISPKGEQRLQWLRSTM